MNASYRKINLLLAGLILISIPIFAQNNREIWVKQISFNWTPDFPRNSDIDIYDAINIRQNPSTEGLYPVPEYAPETGRTEVPAAYYGGEKDIKIKVVFGTSDKNSFYYNIQGRSISSNRVLGDTNIKLVSFSGGISNEIEFTLPGTIPQRFCKTKESWQWIGRESNNYRNLCITKHVIYCLPNYPQTPWKCTGNLTNAPWIDLLDMVLEWINDENSSYLKKLRFLKP
jgi:hypothetical protein